MEPVRISQDSTGAARLRHIWLALLVAAQLAAFGWPAASADAAPGDEVATGGAASEEDGEELPAEVAAGLELLTELQGTVDRFAELTERADQADAEGRSVFEHQTDEAKREYLGIIDGLVEALRDIEDAGHEGGAIRERLESELPQLGPSIARHIDASEKELAALRSRRGEAEPGALLAIEQEVAAELEWLQQLYEGYVDHVDHVASLGLDDSRVREDATARVATRADELAGRVELTNQSLEELAVRLTDDPTDAEGLAKRRALDIRSDTLTAALSNLAGQMDRLDLDSASYRQLVITTMSNDKARLKEKPL